MPVCFILNPGKWHSFDYKKKNKKIGHLFSRRTVLLNILIAADEVRPTDEQKASKSSLSFLSTRAVNIDNPSMTERISVSLK